MRRLSTVELEVELDDGGEARRRAGMPCGEWTLSSLRHTLSFTTMYYFFFFFAVREELYY